ncbi:titin-like isoform X1 [Diorhabda carinulata]|uniref:titin-like isoform X1 n=1 Tax=Diorhabda carinulata TaxID=1163345 RepID=UPI0025A1A956|nr:titin-like isoform X1 [Diorhabda carinulata]
MDSVKAEDELTSTVDNVMSTSNKEEKSDSSDATPTSSTDANTNPTASRTVSDDPISSTSSDSFDPKAPTMSQQSLSTDKTQPTDQVNELLDILDTNEKVTEDVEDLVHDLESLLGEPEEPFNLPPKPNEMVDNKLTSKAGQQVGESADNNLDEIVSPNTESTENIRKCEEEASGTGSCSAVHNEDAEKLSDDKGDNNTQEDNIQQGLSQSIGEDITSSGDKTSISTERRNSEDCREADSVNTQTINETSDANEEKTKLDDNSNNTDKIEEHSSEAEAVPLTREETEDSKEENTNVESPMEISSSEVSSKSKTIPETSNQEAVGSSDNPNQIQVEQKSETDGKDTDTEKGSSLETELVIKTEEVQDSTKEVLQSNTEDLRDVGESISKQIIEANPLKLSEEKSQNEVYKETIEGEASAEPGKSSNVDKSEPESKETEIVCEIEADNEENNENEITGTNITNQSQPDVSTIETEVDILKESTEIDGDCKVNAGKPGASLIVSESQSDCLQIDIQPETVMENKETEDTTSINEFEISNLSGTLKKSTEITDEDEESDKIESTQTVGRNVAAATSDPIQEVIETTEISSRVDESQNDEAKTNDSPQMVIDTMCVASKPDSSSENTKKGVETLEELAKDEDVGVIVEKTQPQIENLQETGLEKVVIDLEVSESSENKESEEQSGTNGQNEIIENNTEVTVPESSDVTVQVDENITSRQKIENSDIIKTVCEETKTVIDIDNSEEKPESRDTKQSEIDIETNVGETSKENKDITEISKPNEDFTKKSDDDIEFIESVENQDNEAEGVVESSEFDTEMIESVEKIQSESTETDKNEECNKTTVESDSADLTPLKTDVESPIILSNNQNAEETDLKAPKVKENDTEIDIIDKVTSTDVDIINKDEIRSDSIKDIERITGCDGIRSKIPDLEFAPLQLSEDDDSDEETVPRLVLTPEHNIISVTDENDDKSPQAEDILEEKCVIVQHVIPPQVDTPENLETILAVASLQNIDIPKNQGDYITEKERKEMEALAIAVQSITDTSSSSYVEDYIDPAILQPNLETEVNGQTTLDIQEPVEAAPVESMVLDESTAENAPVESTQVATAEQAPEETVRKAVDEHAPVESIQKAIIEEKAPAESIQEAVTEKEPVESIKEAVDEERPVNQEAVVERKPVEAIEEAVVKEGPVESMQETVVDKERPAESIKEVVIREGPVESIQEAVVEAERPAESIPKAVVEKGPVEAVLETETPAESIPKAVVEKGTVEAVVEAERHAESIQEAVVESERPAECIQEAVTKQGPVEAVLEAETPAESIPEAVVEKGTVEAIQEAVVEVERPAEGSAESIREAVVEQGPKESVQEAVTGQERPVESTQETVAGESTIVDQIIEETVPEMKEPNDVEAEAVVEYEENVETGSVTEATSIEDGVNVLQAGTVDDKKEIVVIVEENKEDKLKQDAVLQQPVVETSSAKEAASIVHEIDLSDSLHDAIVDSGPNKEIVTPGLDLQVKDGSNASEENTRIGNDKSSKLIENNVVAEDITPIVVPIMSDAKTDLVLLGSQESTNISQCDITKSDREIRSRIPTRKHSKKSEKLEELTINVDVPDREKTYSPKITIKPIKVPDEEVSTTTDSETKGSLKMTITKQSDNMHSILKISDQENSDLTIEPDEPIPKLIIKPKMQQVEQQHSPKMSTRSSKHSPTSSNQRSSSPRITIKPVVKQEQPVSPLKIKINTKTKVSTKEDETTRKLSIKSTVKAVEEPEQQLPSPRITIKPIPKPESEKESNPRLTIKPLKKPEEDVENEDKERCNPKIIIKPIVKPQESEVTPSQQEDEEIKERIVLKINKGNLPHSPTKESKKKDQSLDEDKSEKLAKITVKFSKEGGHPHIVQQLGDESNQKRPHEETVDKNKKLKVDMESVVATRSKHKDHDVIDNKSNPGPELRTKHKDHSLESPVEVKRTKKDNFNEKLKVKDPDTDVCVIESKIDSPIIISEDSRSQDSGSVILLDDVKEDSVSSIDISKYTLKAANLSSVESATQSPIIRKRGRPKKGILSTDVERDSATPSPVPKKKGRPRKTISPVREMEMKETPTEIEIVEFESATPSPISTTPLPIAKKKGRPRKIVADVQEEQKVMEVTNSKQEIHESGRPKRSCRGQSVCDTLGIKPRKSRGSGRGRGSLRGVGNRSFSDRDASFEIKLDVKNLENNVVNNPRESNKVIVIEDIKGKTVENIIIEIDSEDSQPSDITNNPKDSKFVETVEVHSTEVGLQPSFVGKLSVGETGTKFVKNIDKKEAKGSFVKTDVDVKKSLIDVESSIPFSILAPPTTPKDFSQIGTSMRTSQIVPLTKSSNTEIASVSSVSSEIMIVDEDTRMSADTSSRAQTPAKQVVASSDLIEESQSSVHSNGTTLTEYGKTPSRPSKAPRLEVQESDSAIITADHLSEYYWNGNGPFMLQEQVAHFLGIKSFKRKYPGIMRRMLDMQERDYIREQGLASEHMCDLGLTAVNAADILDIMYSDFQDKYEEYCKHQRDRQAKELISKQKALSLAATQEKCKADITEQAVHSAAQWNTKFNKARREQRKTCMDLQNLTVHYPKGKTVPAVPAPHPGDYPVALVPGQFGEYYEEFTPTELNNLPINTMCYDTVNFIPRYDTDDSVSDASDSDSDTSGSSSSSSDTDSSSGIDDCKLCKQQSPKKITPATSPSAVTINPIVTK